MDNQTPINFNEFSSSFKGFLDKVVEHAPKEEPFFLEKLREHFGEEPTRLPILAEEFEPHNHPNLYLALEGYLSSEGRSHNLLGVTGEAFGTLSLTDLIVPGHSPYSRHSPCEGPVQYTNIQLTEGEVLTYVKQGLYLICEGDRKMAVFLRGAGEMSINNKLRLDVMAGTPDEGKSFLNDLRTRMRQRNIYRGAIISLSLDRHHSVSIQFQGLPEIKRTDIILPEGLIERIERHTIHFSDKRDKLLKAGRHLKRGLLLHGPPGTGKTLSAMYLARNMPGRTVILITGQGYGLIEWACYLARLLQPSTVILEDVDLVAKERSDDSAQCLPLLFTLLNEMDGLADDADILFLLTTNRPDILEPALAARPGRVDQAIEIPRPDAPCRHRLFELYGRGMEMKLEELGQFIQRTEGVSAAFIKELMRRAALISAQENEEIVIEDRHIDDALKELLSEGGTLTKLLLGVAQD
ncbi:MAG: AAA family ATPase [Candidatus Xenobiia bacterium LiM19]